MARLVIDASVTLACVLNEPRDSDELVELLGNCEPVAPWIWWLEVTNALLVRERRKLMTPAQSERVLALLDGWNVELSHRVEARSLAEIAHFSRPHQLTTYDAAYLEAAVSHALPLCTLDSNLKRAAKAIGVKLALSGQ